MNKIPYVSIIIPMYNCEKFIYENLKNLNNQIFKDFEVILIDDGSSDSTLEEVYKASNFFYHINLCVKQNGGVSSARNMGLKKAKGKFVMFLDSDDFYPNDYIYEMIRMQKKHPEQMILASVNNIDKEGNILFKYPRRKNNKSTFSKFELFNSIIEIGGYGGFVFNKVFSKALIDDKNITFREDIHFCEDQLFVMEYIDNVEGAVISKNNSYVRVIHKNSFVQSRKTSEKFNPKWETYFVAKKEIESAIMNENTFSNQEIKKLKKINLLSWRNEYYFLKKIAKKYNYSSDCLINTEVELKKRDAFTINLDIYNVYLKNYSFKDLIKSVVFRF